MSNPRNKGSPNRAIRALTTIKNRVHENVNLLAIASCNLGLNLLLTLFNFYYVKVFLEHHHITQQWLYIAQITFLVGSFFIGPVIAYAQDNVFNISRRKMVLIIGPMYALVFLIPWLPWYPIKDKSDPDNWWPGVHLIVVLLLWSTGYFVVNACNCGLFAESSTDHAHRVKALTLNQIAGCIASSFVFPVDALSKSFRDYTSFQICCGGVTCIAASCFIFTGFKASDKIAQAGSPEEEEELRNSEELAPNAPAPAPPVEHGQSHKVKLLTYVTTVKHIGENRNFVCVAIANFLHFFRVVVFQNFLAVYTEGLISESLLPTGSVKVATFYLAAQLSPRLVFLMACPLIHVAGAKLVILGALVLTWLNSATGLFIGTYVGYDPLVATLLLESVLIIFQDAYVMLYSEVIDEDMRKHKRKTPVSTILFTMTTLMLQPSTALAPMIIVKALNIGDYDSYKDNLRHAPPYTKHVLFMVATCVPAVAALISFLSLFFYKGKGKEEKKALVGQNDQDGKKIIE